MNLIPAWVLIVSFHGGDRLVREFDIQGRTPDEAHKACLAAHRQLVKDPGERRIKSALCTWDPKTRAPEDMILPPKK